MHDMRALRGREVGRILVLCAIEELIAVGFCTNDYRVVGRSEYTVLTLSGHAKMYLTAVNVQYRWH